MKRYTNADYVARLMHRVVVTETGCWEYQGQRDPKGYGRFSIYHAKRLAHRVAWTLRHSDPGDLCVLHRCDNPPCVNPAHLFLGTIADNNHDMAAKGRARSGHLTGEAHGRAVLTNAGVAEIRRRYAAGGVTQRQLAAEFGVAQSSIWRANTGRTQFVA